MDVVGASIASGISFFLLWIFSVITIWNTKEILPMYKGITRESFKDFGPFIKRVMPNVILKMTDSLTLSLMTIFAGIYSSEAGAT